MKQDTTKLLDEAVEHYRTTAKVIQKRDLAQQWSAKIIKPKGLTMYSVRRSK